MAYPLSICEPSSSNNQVCTGVLLVFATKHQTQKKNLPLQSNSGLRLETRDSTDTERTKNTKHQQRTPSHNDLLLDYESLHHGANGCCSCHRLNHIGIPMSCGSNSSGSSTTRRTHLRRGSMRTMGGQATRNIFLIDAKQPEASPRVSDCLYSASTSEECSKKEGCVWCKEPLYGLCLTKELAKKMSFLPFLTCSNATTLAVVI